MSDATDIRAWAAERGIEIGARGRIPADVQARFEAEQNGQVEEVPIPDVPPPGPGTQETPPAPPPRGRRWRKPREPRPPRQPRTQDKRKRVPLETWAARGWKMLAYITGAGNTPTSRCLNMQAPVAGIIVDDMIKGTLPDRLLQPLAQWGEKGKDAAALIGLPLLVAATERAPQIYPVTRPLMAEAVTEWVLIAGPAMRKMRDRAAKVAEELGEFDLDEDHLDGIFGSAAENPAVTRILDAIFAPMMPAQGEVIPEPAEAGAA